VIIQGMEQSNTPCDQRDLWCTSHRNRLHERPWLNPSWKKNMSKNAPLLLINANFDPAFCGSPRCANRPLQTRCGHNIPRARRSVGRYYITALRQPDCA